LSFRLSEIARFIGARVRGDENYEIDGIATLTAAQPNHISFLANRKYRRHLSSTRAGAVILNDADSREFRGNALVVVDPYVGYAKAALFFEQSRNIPGGIHSSAVIHETARVATTASIGPHVNIGAGAVIGEHVMIGPGCVVGENVRVGERCRLVANVTLCDGVQLGRRVLVHPGAVIGSDGFGLARERGKWLKIPQLGSVIVGDDVEIGANTAIDRGALDDTVIHDGVKLDNLIQVAHNVRIGRDTAVAGCTAIAGSVTIGERCAIGGGVGIAGHLTLGDGVQVNGMTFVSKSLSQPGTYCSGTIVEPHHNWQKNAVRFKQLNELMRRLKMLECRVAQMSVSRPDSNNDDESDGTQR